MKGSLLRCAEVGCCWCPFFPFFPFFPYFSLDSALLSTTMHPSSTGDMCVPVSMAVVTSSCPAIAGGRWTCYHGRGYMEMNCCGGGLPTAVPHSTEQTWRKRKKEKDQFPRLFARRRRCPGSKRVAGLFRHETLGNIPESMQAGQRDICLGQNQARLRPSPGTVRDSGWMFGRAGEGGSECVLSTYRDEKGLHVYGWGSLSRCGITFLLRFI